MKKRLLATTLATMLLVTSCGGNTDGGTADSTTPSDSPAPVETETETETNTTSDGDYDIYIYNSKGENAEAFDKMAKAYEEETGLTVKTFSIGSGQDHMNTLRAEMNSKQMPTIFSIQGLKELDEWEQGEFVLDLNTIPDGEFKAMTDDIDSGLRLTSDGESSYGIPYNVEGYGYIVDRQMLTDLFDPSTDVDALIADIKGASYDEWKTFVETADAYIKEPSALTVTLMGNTYTMNGEKTGVATNLTGVFSVMGSQKWTYGDHFVNVAINTVFDSPAAAFNATDEEIAQLENSFKKYAEALDLKTSYLAGSEGPEVRGQDFISEAKYGYDQAVQIFVDSKALFLKQGNWAYGNVESANAEMADRLLFLPVKMPIEESDIKVDGLTVEAFNSSIPVFVPNWYVINALVSEEEQNKAMDFLLWLNTSETGSSFVTDEFNFIPYNADPTAIELSNSLGQSILTYMADGNTLQAPYNGSPATWSSDTLGGYLLENYLNKAEWPDNAYDDIAKFGYDAWMDLK